ncbi:hypothetical protein EVAR_83671_1 [Eumeta japonica]|uniref:Uncharacterized protein n=1 Tax=Eumeta variegata TaxID=151549 RepID=A0A4C1UP96_EUMVA|nr:hypothetical protein EVAR_83671_1 [Eumeta japonica]
MPPRTGRRRRHVGEMRCSAGAAARDGKRRSMNMRANARGGLTRVARWSRAARSAGVSGLARPAGAPARPRPRARTPPADSSAGRRGRVSTSAARRRDSLFDFILIIVFEIFPGVSRSEISSQCSTDFNRSGALAVWKIRFAALCTSVIKLHSAARGRAAGGRARGRRPRAPRSTALYRCRRAETSHFTFPLGTLHAIAHREIIATLTQLKTAIITGNLVRS